MIYLFVFIFLECFRMTNSFFDMILWNFFDDEKQNRQIDPWMPSCKQKTLSG